MKNLSIPFFLFFICAVLHAQTADEIQSLLETPAVSYAQAARFVLEAADIITIETSEQDAMSFAAGKNWLSKSADAKDAISLENLSLLIMGAFNLKGGPMYNLFHNAHYSYREMVFKDLIQGRTDPQMKVSGYTMMLIVNRLLFSVEKNPWDMPERREESSAGFSEDEQ